MGEDAKASNAGCIWAILVIVVFAVGAALLTGGGEEAEDGPSDAGAIDVCHQAVRDQLKAPGTADFGGETTTHSGDDYTVTGHVDAENSFGAHLRLDWACDATWTSGSNWRPVTAVVTE